MSQPGQTLERREPRRTPAQARIYKRRLTASPLELGELACKPTWFKWVGTSVKVASRVGNGK